MNPAAMDLHLTDTALTVLEARYLKRDSSGKIVETPEALFQRVARSVAQAERTLGDSKAADRWEEAFWEALTHLDFLPNSPTLMNVGSPLGQLSACFVLPVGDSIAEIFESLKLAALIQQSGGGHGLCLFALAAPRRLRRFHRRHGLRTRLLHAHLRLRHGKRPPGRQTPRR